MQGDRQRGVCPGGGAVGGLHTDRSRCLMGQSGREPSPRYRKTSSHRSIYSFSDRSFFKRGRRTRISDLHFLCIQHTSAMTLASLFITQGSGPPTGHHGIVAWATAVRRCLWGGLSCLWAGLGVHQPPLVRKTADMVGGRPSTSGPLPGNAAMSWGWEVGGALS